MLLASDTVSLASEDDEEVHTVNSSGRIVLDSEVDVFIDTESEVSGGAEVSTFELVLLDLESTLENFHRLVSSDGDVRSDLLVTTDTEATKSVSRLGGDGSLLSDLLQNTDSFGQSITTSSGGDVENELLDGDIPHHVAVFLGLGLKKKKECVR